MLNIWIILLLLVYLAVCVLLMGVILIQSGKGGGLSSLGQSAGGGITDALGATSLEKTLNKVTTGIAVGFMVLAIVLSVTGTIRAKGQTASDLFEGGPGLGGLPPRPGAATTIPAVGDGSVQLDVQPSADLEEVLDALGTAPAQPAEPPL